MKKIFWIMAGLVIIGRCAFAAEEARESKTVIKEVTARAEGLETAEGQVESVTLADLLARPQSKIEIVDPSGKHLVFIVKPAAMIYDHEGSPVTLNTIGTKKNVQVNYRVAKDGTLEAAVIKLLRQEPAPAPAAAAVKKEEAPQEAAKEAAETPAPAAPADEEK